MVTDFKASEEGFIIFSIVVIIIIIISIMIVVDGKMSGTRSQNTKCDELSL